MPRSSKQSATQTDPFLQRLRRARLPVRVAYVGVLFLATLSWMRLDLDPSAIGRRLGRMFNPTVSGRDVIDGARNVVLFAGWGLLWMLTAEPGRSKRALRDAVVSGALLSLLVESLQLLSATRTPSVLDLATNTGGSLLGAVALVALVIALAGRASRPSFFGLPAALLAASYGAAVVGEAFVPLFRQNVGVWASGGPFLRLEGALARFDAATIFAPPLSDFLLFLPAGALAVAALYEHGQSYRRAFGIVAASATLVFPLVEAAHGALGMPIHAGAIAVHVLAVAIGAWAAARLLPAFSRNVRGENRPRLLTACYATALCLWAFRPYAPEVGWAAVGAKFAEEWWIPLRFLGSRLDMFSVVDVAGSFFLFLPLGALLAVWPLRLRGPLSGFLPALYFAAATEVVQTLIAARTLDVTDFLIQAAAAVVGWAVVRRAGFKRYGEQLRGG